MPDLYVITVNGKAAPTQCPLNVGIRPEDGQIVDIGAFRHSVVWIENGARQRSSVTYCNWCGSAMGYGGSYKCDDGYTRKASVCVCKAFLGWD